jgi:hypothetical protein
VTGPLKRDVSQSGSEVGDLQLLSTEVKIAAFALRILALEMYAVLG